ncbi:MAG: Eco57I restriction-modification methylase domain-containing protein [Vicinamibacterales bacterium]
MDTLLAAGVRDQVAGATLVKGIVYGAMQEGFFEELPQSVQEQVLSNIAADRPWDENVKMAAVMGTLAGAVMGGGGQVAALAVAPARPSAVAAPPTPAISPASLPPRVMPIPGPLPGEAVAQQPSVAPPVAQPLPVAMPAPQGQFRAEEATPVEPATPESQVPSEDDRLAAKRAVYQAALERSANPAASADTVMLAQEAANKSGRPINVWLDDGVIKTLLSGAKGAGRLIATIHPEVQPAAEAQPEPQGTFRAEEAEPTAPEWAPDSPYRQTNEEDDDAASQLGIIREEQENRFYTMGRLKEMLSNPANARKTANIERWKKELKDLAETYDGTWSEAESNIVGVDFEAERRGVEARAAEALAGEPSVEPTPAVTEEEQPTPAVATGEQETPTPAPTGPQPTVRYNTPRRSIEVSFPARPAPEVLATLKANKFRWAKTNRVWYRTEPGVDQPQAIARVQQLLGAKAPAEVKPATPSPKPAAQPSAPRAQFTGNRFAEGDAVEVLIDGTWQQTTVDKATDDEGRTRVIHPTLRMQPIVPFGGPRGKSIAVGTASTVPVQVQAHEIRAVAPAPETAQNEPQREAPDVTPATPPRDRDALAGTPPDDGAGARSEGATAEGREPGGRPDRERGERGDTERDTGARGAGDVPGRVGVPPERGRPAEPPARAEPRDLRLSVDDAVAVGGAKQRIANNLAAITTLKALEAEQRPATPDEQQTLVKYVGWGGLSNAFNEGHKDYSPELREALTDEEYAAARASTPNAHYTSLPVIQAVYDGLTRLGVSGPIRMLEPAAGIGHFLGMMPAEMAAKASRAAVELDSITGRIAAALYPNAHVQVTGFQQATLPENSFDLVVSNVPFGNYQVADKAFKGRPKSLTSSIHNYYFAKALDLARDGGVVAFITSHYTMDARDSGVRTYLAERAKLLGAVRLPNTAFKANAGTEVVTDIIFLQKGARSNGVEWISSELAGIDGGHHINRYFVNHSKMVLGRHANTGSMRGGYEYTVEPTGDLTEQLRDAMQQLPAAVYERPTTKAATPTREQQVPVPATVSVPPEAREGSWFQDDKGHLFIRERGQAVAMTDLSPADRGRVKGLLAVRDALRVVMKAMLSPTSTDQQIKQSQKALTHHYDAFVRAHGYIAKRQNYRALREDPDVYTLLALEDWKPKAATPEKAAIFTKRTLRPHIPVESVGTPKEALLVSLNETGRVDWRRMSELTGQSETDLQAALDGLVYFDPHSNTWEQADRYLSGNVKAKLRAAEAAAKTDPKYAANVAALKKVQPADLEPTDIAVRLGSPWVPTDVIDDFAAHLGLHGLTFRYSQAMAKWSADTRRFYGRQSVQNTAQWGTERKSADTLLLASLNLGDPLVYDTVRDPDGKERQVVNQKDTIAAREKQDAIAQEFRSWVWEQPERAAQLSKIYNDTMNTMRLWEPDGSHLSLPGTNPAIQFRPHQKNFIWRGLQQPNALAHHVVGAGKTFAGIALALEKRRLGLARKPMVVVPNHLVQQWARDVLRLYPAARVLASTKKDFEPEHRKRFLNRIATGDWDLVIVPMSHFGMIEVSASTMEDHISKEKALYEEELRRARQELGKNDPTIKELEKAKLNLDGKLRNLKERQSKDTDVIVFEQLGVDMLMVDEAHNYKKLGFPTKMTRVAGVPAGPGSQRAFDLIIKSSGYLAKANPTGGTVFLTGTPISNTMAEMFVLMRYLAQASLNERGIGQFDGWAATFGEKVTAFEISPTGRGFRQKTRFAKFTNLPELIQMYRAFADVQTADMLKLPTPPLKGGKAEVHTVAATPELDDYVNDLMERFAAVLGLDGRQKPDPRVDNPLKITTDGRKAALDLRLVGLEQPPGGKVEQVADNIFDRWQKWSKQKGTQLVFADLGTPAIKGKKKRAAEDGFTVYDALRDTLVEKGIPREQIAFIQEANTDARKQALFDAMNAGDIRVLVGSSETMGAGMNVQYRLVALHHMDAPWRPSDIEQREGRILRQGNGFLDPDSDIYDPNFEVEIHTYVTARSFDAYLWQLLENKARFIRQALKGDLTSRETDDADDVVLNYAQAKGAASGNPAIMEHAKTQSDVQRFEASEANHDRRKWRLQRELASLPEQIAATKAQIANAHTLVEAIDLGDRKDFAITIDGKRLKGQEAAEAIVKRFEQSRTGRRKQLDAYHFVTPDVAIGTAAGVDVHGYFAISNVFDPPVVQPKWMIVKGDAAMEKNAATGAGALNSLAIFLENDPKKALDRATQELATLDSSLEVAKKEVAKPFANTDKLQALRARLKELEQLLNLDAQGQKEEAAKVGALVQTTEEEQADREAEREDEDDSDVAEDLGDFGREPVRRPTGGRVSGDAAVGTFVEEAPRAGGVPPIAHGGGLSDINPVEFPELVDLARALQRVPGVAASFRKADKRGEFRGMQGIRLAADLFTKGNEYQLAKTLAHEIGHLVDWLPHQTLKRGNLLGRLQSLHSFLKHTFTDVSGNTITNKDVKAELMAFSEAWRPWDRETAPAGMARYRDSARELYADALSGLLVDPGGLERTAPTFYRLFFEGLDQKPDVKAAYFDLQAILAGTREELIARRRAGVRRMFEEGDTTALELERRRLAALKQRGKDLWFQLKLDLVDNNYAFIDRVNTLEKQGVRIPEDLDPRYLLEERRHLGAQQKAFVEKTFAPLLKAADDVELSWHAVGEALFFERIIAGDRSELANPRGLSPDAATEMYAALKQELGGERTRVLADILTKFRAAITDVLAQPEAQHLYTDELRAEMQKNPAYATFRVIEHMSDQVTSRVFKQTGTLKDIGNVANATILKLLVTLRAMEHNKVKRQSLAFLSKHFPTDVQPANTAWNGRTHVPVASKDPNLKLITFMENGTRVGRYVDPYIATSLENETVGQNLAIVRLLRLLNSGITIKGVDIGFRPLFTTLNLGFQGFNFFRDFGRFWKNMPGMSLHRALRRYVQAVPLARLRAFGMPHDRAMTPKELQAYKDYLDSEEARVLSFTLNDLNASRTVEDTEIEDIIARSGVAGFGMPAKSWLRQPIRAILTRIKELGDFIETLPKAAAVYEFKGPGSIASLTPAQRSFIRRKVGSPDFKMRGRMTPITNEVFLFSNAIAQAWRSDLEVATDPTTRAGFWWKTAKANLLPKLLMAAALAGLMGETLRRWMQRTTEYDRTNYIVLPIGEDADGNTIYLRVPQDDSGRLVGGVFWKLLQLARGDPDVIQTMTQVVDYTAGQFPGVSPAITTAEDVAAFAGGQNPYDQFRGRNLFTDDELRARDWRTVKKFLGWEFQNLGGGIVWKFYPGEARPRQLTEGQKILELPIVSNVAGRFVRITNYGEVEGLRQAGAKVQRQEARGRLSEREAIGDAIRSLQALPADANRAQATIRAAMRITAELYRTDPAEGMRRAPEIRQMLQRGLLRSASDPVIDAVLSATSNKQKLAILQQAMRQGQVRAPAAAR